MCGLICQHKREVITFGFFTLPMLGLIVCFCWKVYLLSMERAESKEAAKNAQERLSQLETVTADFKGQSLKEKLQDNMQFRQNPLVADVIKDVGNVAFIQMKSLAFRKLLKDSKETKLNRKRSRKCSLKRSGNISRRCPPLRMRFKIWALIDMIRKLVCFISQDASKRYKPSLDRKSVV